MLVSSIQLPYIDLIFLHDLAPLYMFKLYTCAGDSGDEQFCAVHLINEGVTIDGRNVSIFFRGTETVDSYVCKLSGLDISDTANSRPCEFVPFIVYSRVSLIRPLGQCKLARWLHESSRG